jgi:arginase
MKTKLAFTKGNVMTNQFILTPYYIDNYLNGLNYLGQPDWWINDPALPEEEPQKRLVHLYKPLRDFVKRALDEGNRPVSIAGDCCTTLGVTAGLQAAGIDPTLIWFDAHGDFNTWETTPSGFLGGMPLAMLAGRGEQTIVHGVDLKNLEESKIYLADARDLDPGEKVNLSNSEINHLSDVSDLLEISLPEGPLYVHFDTDVINPADAPAMNYLAPGGPTGEFLNQVFDRLAKSGRIAAVSVSSWNPGLDKDGQTAAVMMGLIKTLVG